MSTLIRPLPAVSESAVATRRYISRRRLAENWLRTSFVGSHSQQSLGMNGELELLPTAARFEYGTRNTSDHAGWAAAIEFWESVGWEEVFTAVEQIMRYLGTALAAIDGVKVRPYMFRLLWSDPLTAPFL